MEIVTIILRIVHIFAGVFWVGAVWIGVFFLEPTSRALGADGGKFLGHLVSVRRYPIYLSIAAVLTLLAGWILFFMRYGIAGLQTGPGLAFAIGGILGLIAGGFGGGVVGPTSSKLAALGQEIAQGGKPPTPEQLAQLSALQSRLRRGNVWTAVFASLALLLMALARYA
jgi:hypothetical protein